MATNGSHKELIKTGNFVEKFRNPLRNYYTYGFMDYSVLHPQSEGKKISTTFREDWNRLNNILNTNAYFEWADSPNDVLFISNNSQSQVINPFQRSYRFCLHNATEMVNFFNIILTLSDKYELAENLYTIDGKVQDEQDFTPAIRTISEEEYSRLSANTKITLTDKRISLENSMLDNLETAIAQKQMTTNQLAVFCPNCKGFLNEENKSLLNYCKKLEQLGILRKASDKKPVQWKLNDITLSKIIDCCENEKNNFIMALNFFSRYYILGEFGTYMLSKYHFNQESIFRFKHEYFSQALNDYVLINLLHAIKNKIWCKIKKSNITNDKKSSFLCFPLQIRSSQVTGRQYLSLYEPFQRSYYNIRLDFIEEVTFVKDIKYKSEEINLENEYIKQDIKNAIEAISYSWGVSTTKEQTGNAINPVPRHKVSLTIDYTPGKEYFILNRIKHEMRTGKIKVYSNKIKVSFSVTDTLEMRPWIRTLYSRISDYSGIDNIFEDVNLMHEEKYAMPAGSSSRMVLEIPTEAKYQECECIECNHLFNAILGLYYSIWSDTLSMLYSQEVDRKVENCISQNQFNEIVNEAFRSRENETGRSTFDLMTNGSGDDLQCNIIRYLFMNEGYSQPAYNNKMWKKNLSSKDVKSTYRKSYYQKYRAMTGADLMYNVIPLTTWELKWLKSVLNDPKMMLFISANLKAKIENIIPENIDKINIDDVKYYDRYYSDDFDLQLKPEIFRILIQAISEHKSVEIHYNTKSGNMRKGIYNPLIIEFSKRDNVFRLFLQSENNRRICVMNCERIISCLISNEHFDAEQAKKSLEKFNKINQRSVVLEFKNVRNIPDRILSELSPWKKTCRYNKETGIYTLKVYYHKHDEMDLVIRIMSYGAGVRVTDKQHFIYKEIMRRLNAQIDLFRNRTTDKKQLDK